DYKETVFQTCALPISGISSFGFGGTNTHMIVESANPQLDQGRHRQSEIRNPQSIDRPLQLLKLSAKNDAALKQQAEQLAEYLEEIGRASCRECGYYGR